MLDRVENVGTQKSRAHARAAGDRSLAEVCGKVVLMAVLAKQQQLQSATYLTCWSCDDDLVGLMESVGLTMEDMELINTSHVFKCFKARGFILGPLSHACNIFLSNHLGRWVDGHQSE